MPLLDWSSTSFPTRPRPFIHANHRRNRIERQPLPQTPHPQSLAEGHGCWPWLVPQELNHRWYEFDGRLGLLLLPVGDRRRADPDYCGYLMLEEPALPPYLADVIPDGQGCWCCLLFGSPAHHFHARQKGNAAMPVRLARRRSEQRPPLPLHARSRGALPGPSVGAADRPH